MAIRKKSRGTTTAVNPTGGRGNRTTVDELQDLIQSTRKPYTSIVDLSGRSDVNLTSGVAIRGTGSIYQPTGNVEPGRETGTITDLTEARGTVSGLSGSGATNYAGATNLADSLLKNGASFEDLLATLRFGGTGDLSDAQKQDFNKQILETLLKYAAEQENRQYNQSRLTEQRLYDNPLNQLARLMGSGISRDAAIQMISGGSGSGGSGVITGTTTPVAEGIPASQSALNAEQTKLMPIQTAFGAISAISSAISGLGSFGISAATLGTSLAATRAMTAGQVLSNTQLSNTLKGVESASTVISAISQAVDSGFIKRDKQFDSAQHMVDFIRENAPNFQPFRNLVASGTLDSINKDVYSLNALNAGYKSWRESRDFNIDRKHLVRMQGLEEIFKTLDIGKINSEIELNFAKYDEVIANIINSTKLANSTVALNEANRVKAYAETSNIDAQTDLLHQQYDLQQLDLDWLTANINDINSIRTTQLQLEVAQWDKMTPDELQKQAISWLQDKQNQRTITAIESIYYGNQLHAAQDRQNGGPVLSDQNFANWVVYMHNLFNSAVPNTPATPKSNDVLGALGASGVARFLLKYGKYAL